MHSCPRPSDSASTPSHSNTSPRDTINSLDAPPDGGITAWLQVAAGHFVVFHSWGYMSSYGLFQRYYVENLGMSFSNASWIGAVQTCLVYLVGAFSGRALDAGYLKTTMAIGCVLQVFGTLTLSFATEFWRILLCQGLCTGIGHGMLFAPIISIFSIYFRKRRVIAVALSACGAATGGMAFPAIAYSCLPTIGFSWTVRVMALVILVNSTFIVSVVQSRVPPRKLGPPLELGAFREPSFALFTTGCCFLMWGVYFAYFSISSYARNQQGYSQQDSLILLLVMNGIGVPGRLIPALLADRFHGPLPFFTATVTAAGVLLFCWIGVGSKSGITIWALFYGYFAAGVQSLFPASAGTFAIKDLSKAGSRVGLIFFCVSVTCLTGPPICARLVDLNSGGYLYAQAFGGSAMILGSVFLVLAGRCT